MTTLRGSWLLWALAATLQAEASKPELKIQVFVYNYAGVPAETLARAEREAARIYNRTGIQTEWLGCPLTPDEALRYPTCQLPVSPTRLALRVLSRSMSDRFRLSQATIGSALLREDGGFGMIAQVCALCSEELAKGDTAMYGVILGHVMAHELGHLLLGAGCHAPTGLMHVPWYKKDFESMAQGALRFTAWEGVKIRREVCARMSGDAEAKNQR